jgi:hypothetical protein
MEKAEVYAVLGLEAPAEQPEVADPAAANQGENVLPVTEAAAEDPVQAGADASGTVTGAGDQNAAGTGTQQDAADGDAAQDDGTGRSADHPPVMSKAERARQASLRRQRERDQAVEDALKKAREEHEAETARIFEAMGLTNRYRNNAPIKSQADFDQWQQDAQDAQMAERLQQGQLTPQDLTRAVEASPAFRKIRDGLQGLQDQQKAKQQQEYQTMMDSEIREIGEKYDASIRSIQDILALPTGEEFARLVNENHLSFVQAFRLANADRLGRAQRELADLGARRAVASTSHQQAYGTGARGAVQVPRQVANLYRDLMPDMTDDQIQKDYQRRHRNDG